MRQACFAGPNKVAQTNPISKRIKSVRGGFGSGKSIGRKRSRLPAERMSSISVSTTFNPIAHPSSSRCSLKINSVYIFRSSSRGSSRRQSQVVRMAPDEERLTRRNPLDFPIEWDRPKPGRRPDIFPQFSPMKTPLPPPMPYDPPEEDEEDEEEKEEEEDDPDREESDQPER